MAQTDHLPIYKAAYDLCLYLEEVVRNFARYHKYSIGQDLRDGARRVLRLIVRANARREKARVLLQIREEVEELKVLMRLSQDAKAFASFNASPVLFVDRYELLGRPRGFCAAAPRRLRIASPSRPSS